MNQPRHAYHVMAKPAGPLCNLNCRYCFYVEKRHLYPDAAGFKMPDDVLERFVHQYIEGQQAPEIQFAWQGGEPTLMGIDFFRKVVRLQQKYANGRRITNAIQTNGTLLNDRWCEFLSEHRFLVGVSLDGPRELHDRYRRDKKEQPCFDAVMRAIEFMKKHETSFNLLTVVNDANVRDPLRVYRFLKRVGSGFIQFIPAVERKSDPSVRQLGLTLAAPPIPNADSSAGSEVTSWSVKPKPLADFYCQIFDQWVRQDVGQVFVQFFDVALGNWLGSGPGLCQFAPECGDAAVIEHNGDVYACDHFVYPHFRIGNILDTPLNELMNSAAQRRFGQAKREALPPDCRICEVRFACHGDCPKHRFAAASDGTPRLSYLCPAYKRIFTHMTPYMNAMAERVRSGRPAAEVMTLVRAADRKKAFATVKRNAPCPCNSGKKFKKCCGA